MRRRNKKNEEEEEEGEIKRNKKNERLFARFSQGRRPTEREGNGATKIHNSIFSRKLRLSPDRIPLHAFEPQDLKTPLRTNLPARDTERSTVCVPVVYSLFFSLSLLSLLSLRRPPLCREGWSNRRPVIFKRTATTRAGK